MPAGSEVEEIRRVLVDRLGCHAVILYGSRAKGTARPGSDWDVVGIRQTGESVREARPFRDGWLDAFVYPESHYDVLDEGVLRLRDGKILVDDRGFAKKLLVRVAAFESAGPPPLPPGDEAMLRAWFPKMLARAARGDVEAGYRRAWLLHDALPAYFQLRRRFYRGPKESLAWLERHDPTAYQAFARALTKDADEDALSALVSAVLAE